MGNELLSAITLGAVVLSAIVQIVGLVSRHDTQVVADARRDAKLDTILEKMESMSTLEKTVNALGERMYKNELEQKGLKKTLEDLCEEHRENLKPLNLKCRGATNEQ